LLIHIDFVDCCGHSWRVESEKDQTDENAALVAQHSPAEMEEEWEQQETADADADENKSSGHRWPRAGLNRAQVRVLVRIEVLDTLDRLSNLDITHACVQHLYDQDEERGHSLDYTVEDVQRWITVAQVKCRLHVSYSYTLWINWYAANHSNEYSSLVTVPTV